MNLQNQYLIDLYESLTIEIANIDQPHLIFKNPKLNEAGAKIATLPNDQKADYGKQFNLLKTMLQENVDSLTNAVSTKSPIDITADFDINTPAELRPKLLPANQGSIHPISKEIKNMSDIFERMGFTIYQSREIDDDFHMFEALNFPKGHPARDDWDTFMTDEGLIAPAHTSTMQHRILAENKAILERGGVISAVVPDRVFRNEDVDVTHEHTFHQIEGIFVSQTANVGELISVLKTFMSEYFQEELNVKIQPFYFPFTEPSFEFAVTRPTLLKVGNSEADNWLEIGGCGMIHPNVLTMAGIDSQKYSGFAWGFGIERMIIMKYGLDDIRYFQSGKIEFLEKF